MKIYNVAFLVSQPVKTNMCILFGVRVCGGIWEGWGVCREGLESEKILPSYIHHLCAKYRHCGNLMIYQFSAPVSYVWHGLKV